MEIIPLVPAFKDNRGTITDLLNDVEIRHVAVIDSVTGSVRGNHYHVQSSQFNYVIAGKVEVVTRDRKGEVTRRFLSKGDFFLTPPYCEHAMRFLEDSELLVLTTKARSGGGYEEDTIRLKDPLISVDAEETT